MGKVDALPNGRLSVHCHVNSCAQVFTSRGKTARRGCQDNEEIIERLLFPSAITPGMARKHANRANDSSGEVWQFT